MQEKTQNVTLLVELRAEKISMKLFLTWTFLNRVQNTSKMKYGAILQSRSN